MSQLINITNATDDIPLQCEDYREGFILWTCATVVSFVFGFPGVVAILLDLFQKVRKGTPFTPNEVLMLNITVMDGVYLLFLQLKLYNILHWHNPTFEEFTSFLFSFNECGRPLFTTCICLDCYLAVVHPVTYRARKSLTPRVLMAVGVWTLTVAYGCYIGTGHIMGTFLLPILMCALMLSVTGYCDFSIFWTLKTSNPGGRDVHPQKKKALQIIINNLVVTFLSYLPPIIALVVSLFLNWDDGTIFCLLVIPTMFMTVAGNTVSVILHLNNLGKLDWPKYWKQK